MEQESFKDMTLKIILDIKYQFYVIIFLIFTLIFKMIFTQQYLRLTNYLYKILPKFINAILSISIYEVKAIQLFLIVIIIGSLAIICLISLLVEQKIVRNINYYNAFNTIRVFEKWVITGVNGVVAISIISNLYGYQNIYDFMINPIFYIIAGVYLLSVLSFFIEKD